MPIGLFHSRLDGSKYWKQFRNQGNLLSIVSSFHTNISIIGCLRLLIIVGFTRSFTAQPGDDMVWYSTNRCYSDNTDTNHVWTFTQGGTITSKTMSGGLNAKAVFVRWQYTDFQTTATTTTDSKATSTGSTARNAVSSSGPLATATTPSTGQSGSSQGGSSRAWIAGPVIGVVVGCVLIALAATWYNRRRWRQKGPTGAELPVKPSTEPPHDMAELYQEPKVFEAPCKPAYSGPFELSTTQHR